MRLPSMLLRRLVMAGTVVAGGTVAATTSPVVTTASAGAECTISATVREGGRGADVVCLETQLVARGLAGIIGPDDYFGPSTTQAVFIFQATNGLAIDGIVGPKTRAALGAAGAPLSAPVATIPAHIRETRVIGTSVQGRPIKAVRMGTPGGRVVMIVGIIHGDETKGSLVTSVLKTLPTPTGIDLWLIDSMNPDGVANGTRGNANGVDLNRNFDVDWNYIPRSTTNHQYSGENPADQPETQAMEAFIREVQPAVMVWYHQDANVISINGARRVIPTLYGKLVGLGTGNVPCSQLCTGTAGTFVNRSVVGATSFLVELPGSAAVTSSMIRRHATAVLSVAVL